MAHAFIDFAFFKPTLTIINMADTWMIIFVVVGIIVLFAGLIGGYMTYLGEMYDFFPVWILIAFIGIVLTLAGFAMGMQEKSGSKE